MNKTIKINDKDYTVITPTFKHAAIITKAGEAAGNGESTGMAAMLDLAKHLLVDSNNTPIGNKLDDAPFDMKLFETIITEVSDVCFASPDGKSEGNE